MLTQENLLKLKFEASNFLLIWEKFCKQHTHLYDLTCEEYVHLLSSDIEELEKTIETKNTHLEDIKNLDTTRQELISKLQSYSSPGQKLEKVSDVLSLFKNSGLTEEAKQLEGFNQILLDIIGKIQGQNKKNQFFLNKAILSLKDLKKNFAGKKCYTTYGANGTATQT
jgi:flagellar biosynthesis/type III secretory pathway chaperone